MAANAQDEKFCHGGEVWAGTDPQLGETLGERLAKAAMVVTINDDLIT